MKSRQCAATESPAIRPMSMKTAWRSLTIVSTEPLWCGWYGALRLANKTP
jgi:hypothetical protein